ncbi:flavodoxin family protein [Salininema proteolyticum]|uniref:Flavodoxin family protein n=1 Tax=Salininema proteolyticum TaxID=1607685 RepID=A0ABV8TVY3_9ACTN
MKSIIVCASVSHGNTKKVADAMSEVLDAPVLSPAQVRVEDLESCDLVGFGSGIYYQRFHPQLLRLVRSLPITRRGRAFIFATSGFSEPPFRRYTRSLRRLLERKGFDVRDAYQCRGFDTSLPFKLVGGVRRGRPDEQDIAGAREFAANLREHSSS